MTLATFKAGVANDLRNALVRNAPVDNGRLKNSIKVRLEDNKIKVYIVDYAIFVEYGTQPHIIRPKNAKALKFKKDNKTVFAKEVHHPGTKANPFMRNTFYHEFTKIVEKNAIKHLGAFDTINVKLK